MVEALPHTLDAEQSATLPIAALIAWHAVMVPCRVGPGDAVLVHRTGGVALFAMQFAMALGVRVAVTTSSPEKARRIAQLGATLTIDYRQTDVAQEVSAGRIGRGVDHVIETVGGDNLNTHRDQYASTGLSRSLG
jgi:NADPH:quinone reductase-like Zn-dependent oxidoreductase